MNQIYILCVDDEPDVLDVVIRDLSDLEDVFPIECAANAKDARDIIDAILKKGDQVGVILCDHVMPGENGVDLLVSLDRVEQTKSTRKVLLTGQAGLDATILAVNEASLSHYIAKPWDSGELMNVTKKQLSGYIISEGINPTAYLPYLDAETMAAAIRGGLLGDS